MMQGDELEKRFSVYLDEITRCKKGQCWFGLLHLALVLPDICGALESNNGVASGARYRQWCDGNLPGKPLSSGDRWEMRCTVLHQGTSLPLRGQYTSFSFVDPVSAFVFPHGHVSQQPSGADLAVNVETLADEVVSALRRWFVKLQESSHRKKLENVHRNIVTLVQVKPKTETKVVSTAEGRVLTVTLHSPATTST